MGILDSILGAVTGKSSGGGSGMEQLLMNAVIGMVTNKQSGGLNGLVDMFSKSGLSDIVSSWVSTGQNLPISGDQITKVLGNQQVSQLASKAGVPMDQIGSLLAQVLPTVVDKLTPQGKIPTEDLLQAGIGMLLGGKK
jgi:uncharacterized protein YidB (DUF937 family)